MFFWKRKPKRLYIPVKANWYTRPRRPTPNKPRNVIVLKKRGVFGLLKDFAKRSAYGVAILASAAVLLGILSLSSYFSIKSIEVDRASFNIDTAKIENRLAPYVGKNLVFFQKSQIETTIRKLFPEFSDIQIQKVFPSKIKIKLVSYPMVANLRAYYVLPPPEEPVPQNYTELNKAIEELSSSDPTLSNAALSNPLEDKTATKDIFSLGDGDTENQPAETEQKALINQIGQAIFDQQENLELMTFVVRGLTQPIQDREFVVPQDTMAYIQGAIQYFTNSMALEPLSVEYLSVANEVHLKTKNNLVVWLSIDRDYKEQIDKLKTIYEPAELNKENLAYIDLRIKDKVIYCPRNAKCDKTEGQAPN
jgi:cell division septal protein FtsQ